MKITISGSLGNVGKPLTKKLVAAGHQVTVISHSEERKANIEKLGATAAIGSVTDADFLARAFTGADAVYVLLPPRLASSNMLAGTVNAGKAFASAIRQAGTLRVVLQSSLGADQPEGTGPIAALYAIEKIFSEVEGTSFTFLRNGYFYTNFLEEVDIINGMGIMGGNYPANMDLPLVHPDDIATAAAEELQSTTVAGNHVRYVVSDIRHPDELAQIIGAAIGKHDLHWVEFTDEQSIQGMKQAGLPDELAKLLTEMGASFRNGKSFEEYEKKGSPVTGEIKLEDYAQEFAKAYKGELQHAK